MKFDTSIHGGLNGRTQYDIWYEVFTDENGKILCMTCNGQVTYRSRKTITHCGCVKNKKIDQIRRESCETFIIQISKTWNCNERFEEPSSALLEEFGGDKKYAKIAM